MRTLAVIFSLCLLSLGAMGQLSLAPSPSGWALIQAPKSPPPKLVAIVTDTNGASTEVVDLKARYWDERQGSNRLDPEELPSIVIQIETREGRITTTDELVVRFNEVRRIHFPGNFRVEIERRDGSKLVVDQIRAPDWTLERQRVLQERDRQESVIKELKFYGYEIATWKQDGMVAGAKVMRRMVLGAFVGRATTASGREGTFSILKGEVNTIEFK